MPGHTYVRAAAIVAVVAALVVGEIRTSTALAQPSAPASSYAWVQRDGAPTPRFNHVMAYDSVASRVVLFGGVPPELEPNPAQTWQWDGSEWSQLRPAVAPRVEIAARGAMVFDAARRRLVLFKSRRRSPLGFPVDETPGETWEFDGSGWVQREPTVSPRQREGHAMAYDATRQRVVLFGGCCGPEATRLGDTWEWDGENWTQRSPAVSPPPRTDHAMAYDAARQQVVLFGGSTPDEANDTWIWDGSTWRPALTASPPPPRIRHAMAYDAAHQQVVLFAGFGGTLPNSNQVLADTWTWDGSTWTPGPEPSASTPAPRQHHAMAYDGSRVVLYGGIYRDGRHAADTWLWDGESWMHAYTPPSPRVFHGLAYDTARQRPVLFGGFAEGIHGTGPTLGDTWERVSGKWVQRFSADSPTPRQRHAMAYDGANNGVVLFGGRTSGGRLSDTWTWDGATWTKRATQSGPGPRQEHRMVYDPSRRRVLLFGGWSGNALADTWQWDGTKWTLLTPKASPPARFGHVMAYDAARRRVVLFGGCGKKSLFFGDEICDASRTDTWEWDGRTWLQRPTDQPPGGGDQWAMAYDADRQRTHLFLRADEHWQWDGTAWLPVASSGTPAARRRSVTVYDDMLGRIVLFGGETNFGALNETWELEVT